MGDNETTKRTMLLAAKAFSSVGTFAAYLNASEEDFAVLASRRG